MFQLPLDLFADNVLS